MSDAPTPQPNQDGSKLGQLFVVPFLIVSLVVGCVVVVVLGFGSITSSKHEPLDKLLARLEGGRGDRQAGMMMPRDKELWQAAQELAMRIENDEIPAEALGELQQRLSAILRSEIESGEIEPGHRLFFTMRAAAKSGSPDAAELFLSLLKHDSEEVRREALGSLALLPQRPADRTVLDGVARALSDRAAVVRLVACTAISNLTAPGDRVMIQVLHRAYDDNPDDSELQFNVALTLARLGDNSHPVAALTLQDMLRREFWAKQRIQYGNADATVDRPLHQRQIEHYLIAAIDAAAVLDDEEVWGLIGELKSDNSLAVANHARTIGQSRKNAGVSDQVN